MRRGASGIEYLESEMASLGSCRKFEWKEDALKLRLMPPRKSEMIYDPN
jgi:hypothetical protein